MNKPSLPLTIPILALVAVAGLVAQFLAAEAAFSLIAQSGIHAFAAALLIESAVVVDALVAARSRNPLAIIGLVIALLASGVYNYMLAAHADTSLNMVELVALAIGPLAALASIGLVLGEEVYDYESTRQKWQDAEQDLVRHEATQSVTTAQAVQRTLDRERQDQIVFERSLVLQRQEHELHEQQLATRRAERWARKKRAATPVLASLRTRDMFLIAVQSHPELAKITPRELARATGHTARVAGEWIAEARNGRKDHQ